MMCSGVKLRLLQDAHANVLRYIAGMRAAKRLGLRVGYRYAWPGSQRGRGSSRIGLVGLYRLACCLREGTAGGENKGIKNAQRRRIWIWEHVDSTCSSCAKFGRVELEMQACGKPLAIAS